MKKYGWTLGIVAFVVAMGCGGSKDALWKRGPMHPMGNFDGVYQSDFGRLELTAEGSRVTGLYEKNDKVGRIEGEVKSNLLLFKWTQWDMGMKGKDRETNGRGVFQYMVDEAQLSGGATKENHWLKGFWAYGKDEPTNPWNAYKYPPKVKKTLKPFDPDKNWNKEEEEEYEETSFDDTGAGGEGGGGESGGGEGGGGEGGGQESAAPPPSGGGGGSGANDPDIF